MSHLLPPLQVRSLICHAHVTMGIQCLSTLFRFSDRAIDLHLHDDGSITPDDEARLKAAFPGMKLIRRAEADALVAERLRDLPACRAFRERYISGLKIFDALFMSREPFLLLDTDVLFFNPFENLLDENAADKALVYMEDYMYAYPLTPWEVIAHRELRSVYRLNSGMMTVRGDRIDPGFIEHLLTRYPHFSRNWQAEQAIWAILGRKYGAGRWNPRLVTVVTPDFQPTPDQVAGHFVSLSRPRLSEFLSSTAESTPGRRIRLEVEPAPDYSPLQLTYDYLGNRTHNFFYRMRHPAPAS